jgi:hypothetical protein
MKSLITAFRNYVWVPRGETIRGAEVAVTWTVVRLAVTQDWTVYESYHTYEGALIAAAITALVGYIKGLIPPAA